MFVYSLSIPIRIKMQMTLVDDGENGFYICCNVLKYLLLPFSKEKFHHLFAEIDKSRYLCTRK